MTEVPKPTFSLSLNRKLPQRLQTAHQSGAKIATKAPIALFENPDVFGEQGQAKIAQRVDQINASPIVFESNRLVQDDVAPFVVPLIKENKWLKAAGNEEGDIALAVLKGVIVLLQT